MPAAPRRCSSACAATSRAEARTELQAAIDKSQEKVTGTVRVKLYKGNATVIGRDFTDNALRIAVPFVSDCGDLRRIKEILFVGGQNHYPQDIEQTVWDCDARLRPGCGAAFAVERDGEETLVIVQEVDAPAPELPALAARVRDAVHEQHGLRLATLVLIPPRTIAKTSSGKIQRRACRQHHLAGSLRVLHTEVSA